MSASTVLAAKQRILDILTARSGLTGVTIRWGEPPNEDEMRGDMIYFSGPPGAPSVTRTPVWRIIGGQALDEDYTLRLRVRVIRQGTDEKTTEARAWALVDEVEQAIRGDLQLQGTNPSPLLRKQIDLSEQTMDVNPTPNGWFADATVALDCHARI